MSGPRQLRDEWVAFVREQKHGSFQSPEVFEKSLRESIEQLTVQIQERIRGDLSDPKQRASVESRVQKAVNEFVGKENSTLSRAIANYRSVRSEVDRLRSHRVQYQKAATLDYIKMYFWRTLQAFTIAGVILLTGYIAGRFNIPLPWLRVV